MGRRLFNVFWLPVLMIVVGACCLAVAGILGDEPSSYIPLTIVGLPLTIAGPFMGLRGLFGIFSEDDFLEVRSTGLRARTGNQVQYAAWEELESIRTNPDGQGIIIEFEHDVQWLIPHSFLGFQDDVLCKHLAELRTKGLMGLLRPTSTERQRSEKH